MAAVIFALGAGMAWLAVDSVRTEETYFPKRHGPERIVKKKDAPSLFWGCVSFYSFVSLGSAALAGSRRMRIVARFSSCSNSRRLARPVTGS